MGESDNSEMDFGTTVRKLRKKFHIPLATLAKHLGISRYTLTRWEDGFKIPSDDEKTRTIDFLMSYTPFSPEDLRKKRVEKGLTQLQVANVIRVGKHVISNYERGLNSPSYNTQKEIEEFLANFQTRIFLSPEEIRKERKRCGLTLKRLSELTGIHLNRICRYEHGEIPSPRNMNKLVNAFDSIKKASPKMLIGNSGNSEMNFGTFLFKMRKEYLISIQSLADILGVTYYKISAWEKNRSIPSPEDQTMVVNFFVSLKKFSSEDFRRNRLERHISRKEIAFYLGVTEETISSYESGSSTPSIERQKEIEKFFSTKPKIGYLSSDEILAKRKMCGLSQKELGKFVGLNESTINTYEHGTGPSLSNMAKLITFFSTYLGKHYK